MKTDKNLNRNKNISKDSEKYSDPIKKGGVQSKSMNEQGSSRVEDEGEGFGGSSKSKKSSFELDRDELGKSGTQNLGSKSSDKRVDEPSRGGSSEDISSRRGSDRRDSGRDL